MDVRLEKVASEDIAEINRIQKLAFRESYEKYRFCPAYEATDKSMAVNIERADAYKILADNETVGSVFIYQTGENIYELDTISVHPEYQNRGIGDRAISLVESNYPDAVCWTLQTPEKDIRNRYLYEKHGYQAVDSVEINEYLSLIQYKKQLKETL